jgi:hypothetical protein
MSRFVTANKEVIFNDVLDAMKSYSFPTFKKIDERTAVYDINYNKLKLHVLETFDEGECVLANRI